MLQSFQAENFKIHSDYVRPCFSPDGVYIACGSQSGDIFIWNRETCKLEKILHGHELVNLLINAAATIVI